jgi:hypothetical protein
MNKLKTYVSLIILIFISFSTEAKFYSIIVKEHQLSGMECKMVVYSIFFDHNNYDPIDDKLIGTYTAIIGGQCTDDPTSGNVKAEIVPMNQKTSIYAVTSVFDIQLASDVSNSKSEMIPPSCYLITTTFYEDNGTPVIKKDDLQLGNHHVSIKYVDGLFSDSKGFCGSLENVRNNGVFMTNGLNYEIKTFDPEHHRKLQELNPQKGQ